MVHKSFRRICTMQWECRMREAAEEKLSYTQDSPLYTFNTLILPVKLVIKGGVKGGA